MRIALMTLTQLVAGGDESQQSAMVEAGLPRIVRIRSAQAWSDEDIPGLLESLDESLNTSVAVLSSFDKYRQEVLTGGLEWTPMHTSKAFWQARHRTLDLHACIPMSCLYAFSTARAHGGDYHRGQEMLEEGMFFDRRDCRRVWPSWVTRVQENISAFEDMDFQLLRCLITLLESSDNPIVLAVGCNDLGMFADVHPHGRYIINDLGGKPHVMRHMASQEAEVAKHALVCVQRLMLGKDKLDFLHDKKRGAAANGSSTSAAVA